MRPPRLLALRFLALILAAGAAAGGATAVAGLPPPPDVPPSPSPPPSLPPPDALAALGRRLFFDAGLSQPRGTSCASCHDPIHAFSGTNGSTIGVPRGSRRDHFARRTSPSVLYLRYVPRFHFYQEEDAPLPSAFGGFFWDGRADSIAALVTQPLLNPDEMNNRDLRQLAGKLRAAGYTQDFRHLLDVALDGPDTGGAGDAAAAAGLGRALEAFLTSPAMAPFSSRYDAYVRGRAVFTAQEERGLKLFKDPDRGNCASCHRLTVSSPNPERSMFTDYGFDTVAAPRNGKLPANRRPRAFDLGLCERKDRRTPSSDGIWCSSFRTPSLRNVAVRQSFMHNGAFTSLRDVVAYYATRATDPRRWYRSGVKFDDVPSRYRAQVNVNSIPYNRREGDVPALDDAGIDAIVAFLRTLTDSGFR